MILTLIEENRLRITIVLPDASLHPVGGYKVQYIYARELSLRGHRVTVVNIQFGLFEQP